MTAARVRQAVATIEVEFALRLVSEANQREHWAKKHKRAQQHRGLIRWALGGRKRPALPCVVTITRIAPRSLDSDNLVGSAKATRDGIADWLGVNDKDPLVVWNVRQERGAPKQYGVRVTIEETPI